MSFLQVSGIVKTLQTDPIVKNITFSQRRFQKIAIIGETGSGKSTLLKIIAGLIQPDEGEVVFEDQRIEGPAEKLVPGHPSIAYLSQHFELPHSLRVEQVLEYANMLTNDEAGVLYEICEIDHLLKRRTDQLSGGETQRIAIARLLIGKPKLLLLDEPYSNLDRVHKVVLRSIIDAIGKKLNVTCIMISHDPEDTLPWADMILVMKDGAIIQKGSPEKIYNKPIDAYTAGLLGDYTVLDATLTEAFAKANGVPIRKKLILRPETLRLTTKKSKALCGEITEVNFYGGYYLVEVSILNKVVIIRTEEQNFRSGDRVYVSLAVAE